LSAGLDLSKRTTWGRLDTSACPSSPRPHRARPLAARADEERVQAHRAAVDHLPARALVTNDDDDGGDDDDADGDDEMVVVMTDRTEYLSGSPCAQTNPARGWGRTTSTTGVLVASTARPSAT
jgi:hypothetical protein